jgi:hypothetical protein
MSLDTATIFKVKSLAAEKASTVSALVRDMVRERWQDQADDVNKQLKDA